MAGNFVEELVAEYYKFKGYFVCQNYWFPFQSDRSRTRAGKVEKYTAQSWSDIDVMAMNEKELLLIQVKAIINQESVAEGIVKFFKRTDDFLKAGKSLDGNQSIGWWTEGRKIRRIVVHENDHSVPKYINLLRAKGIEVNPFRQIFNEMVTYIQQKKGVKEDNPVMRFMHFLNDYKALQQIGKK